MCASKMLAVAFAALGACSSSMRVRKSAVETKAAAGETIMPILESDFNPIGEGTINGAHGLLVMTFGDGVGMHVDSLRDISLSRKFPADYTFTGTIHPQVAVAESDRENWLSEEQMAAESPHPRENPGSNGFVLATMENINFIICPFLSTMVNEGALPLRQNYTKAELQDATAVAGLDPAVGQSHVDGNFLHDPDQIQDIWNMEGFTNEHVTSTGIHDCVTAFRFCEHEHAPNAHCVTSTPRDCRHPNRVKFEQFVTAVDTNNDDFITIAELDAAAALAEEHGIPVSAKHEEEFDEDACRANCESLGHCCADISIGSNQYVSCYQACNARASGLTPFQCKQGCTGERSCNRQVGDLTFRACQTCSDLRRSCPFGVPSEQACFDGCSYE